MTLFKLGKYKYDLLFRPRVFWIGIYPNEKRGTICIAFFMVILRITDTSHKFQNVITFYKECLLDALQQLNDDQYITIENGDRLKVDILRKVVKHSKPVKNYA